MYLVRRHGSQLQRAKDGPEMTRLLVQAMRDGASVELGVEGRAWEPEVGADPSGEPVMYFAKFKADDLLLAAYEDEAAELTQLVGCAGDVVTRLPGVWSETNASRVVLAWRDGRSRNVLVLHRRI